MVFKVFYMDLHTFVITAVQFLKLLTSYTNQRATSQVKAKSRLSIAILFLVKRGPTYWHLLVYAWGHFKFCCFILQGLFCGQFIPYTAGRQKWQKALEKLNNKIRSWENTILCLFWGRCARVSSLGTLSSFFSGGMKLYSTRSFTAQLSKSLIFLQ